jgi:hypothetical protein
MIDLVMSILIIAGTYLGGVGFSILLFRLFFPLESKPVAKNPLTFTYFKNDTAHASSKTRMAFMSDGGGKRAWVKVSS